jgi:phage major head subunit gpT-like protein
MWKQAEFHSAKRLGVRPRWCLVPIELEKTALTIFESDFEPGGDAHDANVRRASSR